ncbi:MAG: hypothetical protein SVV03_06555 [Candidatus Nanohaloarchaea archaeon]|nr:hypothetical protein [Candidatus Nanohaloarchaea archaeon]
MTDKEVTEEEFKIARFRLETMPAHLEVSLGDKGSFTKEDLKEHIEKRDSVGEAYTRMQMAGLRAFKEI